MLNYLRNVRQNQFHKLYLISITNLIPFPRGKDKVSPFRVKVMYPPMHYSLIRIMLKITRSKNTAQQLGSCRPQNKFKAENLIPITPLQKIKVNRTHAFRMSDRHSTRTQLSRAFSSRHEAHQTVVDAITQVEVKRSIRSIHSSKGSLSAMSPVAPIGTVKPAVYPNAILGKEQPNA
jgi:hypothetical protein